MTHQFTKNNFFLLIVCLSLLCSICFIDTVLGQQTTQERRARHRALKEYFNSRPYLWRDRDVYHVEQRYSFKHQDCYEVCNPETHLCTSICPDDEEYYFEEQRLASKLQYCDHVCSPETNMCSFVCYDDEDTYSEGTHHHCHRQQTNVEPQENLQEKEKNIPQVHDCVDNTGCLEKDCIPEKEKEVFVGTCQTGQSPDSKIQCGLFLSCDPSMGCVNSKPDSSEKLHSFEEEKEKEVIVDTCQTGQCLGSKIKCELTAEQIAAYLRLPEMEVSRIVKNFSLEAIMILTVCVLVIVRLIYQFLTYFVDVCESFMLLKKRFPNEKTPGWAKWLIFLFRYGGYFAVFACIEGPFCISFACLFVKILIRVIVILCKTQYLLSKVRRIGDQQEIYLALKFEAEATPNIPSEAVPESETEQPQPQPQPQLQEKEKEKEKEKENTSKKNEDLSKFDSKPELES